MDTEEHWVSLHHHTGLLKSLGLVGVEYCSKLWVQNATSAYML